MKTAPKNHLAPLKEVEEWFDQALRASDPRPSAVTLVKLARELYITVNCRHNLEGASPESLKDLNADEELYKLITMRSIRRAAGIDDGQ